MLVCAFFWSQSIARAVTAGRGINNGSTSNNNQIQKTANKKTLATVVSAENQTYTSDNRLFVTGDQGIFELIVQANGSVVSVQLIKNSGCAFAGIVEIKRTLYANCYARNTSYIYAASLEKTPSFKNIATLNDVWLANGLTADNSGRLYVASTFKGQILRLTPHVEKPYSIAKTEVWLNNAGLATNGIKYFNNKVYWTDGSVVKSVQVLSNGKPGSQSTVFWGFAFFDDFIVDNAEFTLVDFVGGTVRNYNLNGSLKKIVPASLFGPSSVQKARSPLPSGSLIVTERLGGRVSLVTP